MTLPTSLPVVWHERVGAWLREGSNDERVSREVLHYKRLPVKDAVVLDVGAHIGLATLFFLQQGARQVIAVEPEQSNVALWHMNCDGESRARLIEAAVGQEDGETDLYVPTKPSSWPGSRGCVLTANSSTIAVRGRARVPVASASFERLLTETEASIVKVDAEGAEYDLLETPLPPQVRALAVEIHILWGIKRERADALVNHIREQGFTFLRLTGQSAPRPGAWAQPSMEAVAAR